MIRRFILWWFGITPEPQALWFKLQRISSLGYVKGEFIEIESFAASVCEYVEVWIGQHCVMNIRLTSTTNVVKGDVVKIPLSHLTMVIRRDNALFQAIKTTIETHQ